MVHLRSAVRKLITSPGPSFVIVLTLAVAIAASVIIYCTIDVVWHAIPAADTERLVFIASTDPRLGEAQAGVSDGVAWTGVSSPDLADWVAATSSFEAFAGFRFGTATLAGLEAPLRVSTVRATANLLSMWGVTPAMGRGFHDEEGRPGGAAVVLLTDRFWKGELDSDPAAVGRTVLVDDVAHTVVGVLRPETGTGVFRDADVMVPFVLDSVRDARDDRRLFTVARLKPGVSRERAFAELDTVVRRLRADHPRTNGQIGVVVRPAIDMLGGNVRALLLLLVLIAVLVIAMTCANLSNVFLAQATARGRELSVRSALGASRLHHVGRFMLESLILSLAAGVAGLLLALGGVAAIRWFAGANTYGFSDLAVNGRVLALAAMTACVVPLGFALVPALQASHPDPQVLKDGLRSAGTPGRRLRRVLVAVQVALAIVVMIQVAVFARTAWALSHVEKGFDPEGVLTFRIELPQASYPDDARTAQFYRDLLARLRAIPGVASTAGIDRLPVADREFTIRPVIDGAPALSPEERPFAALATVSEDYLTTLRIPLLRGRGFTAADLADGSPVAIVSEEAARRLWGGRDPLGRQLAVNTPPFPGSPLTVVGITGNVRNSDVDRGSIAQIYVPLSWHPQRAMAVVVRAERAEPASLTAAIRTRVAGIDPDLPIYAVASMDQIVFDDLAGGTTLAVILAVIGIVALCVAAAGIYGVVSYSVNQRRREIGIRMALGARPAAVRRLVLRQGALPVAGGAVVGFAAAIALAYTTAASVQEIDPGDPLGYLIVAGALGAVALLATGIPARRAALLDPAVTLRAE